METLVSTDRLRSEARIGGRQCVADGVNPNLCNDGNSANLRIWGIRPPLTDPTAAVAASGSVTPGTHLVAVTFAIVKAGAIFVESNPKDTVSVEVGAAGNRINLTNLPISDNDAVNARIIYMTKAGGSTLYRLATSTPTVADNTTTSYAITLADTALSAVELSYANEFLPAKPYVTEYNSRLLLWGDVPWTRGTVAVTNGSPTVAGTGTQWTRALEGRRLVVAGGQLAYQVSAVDVAAQELTLTANYQGANASAQAYRLVGAANDLYVSSALPLSPEGYDLANPNSVIPVREDDQDEPRGFMRTRDLLYLAKRRHVYLLNGSGPANYDITEVSRAHGLASNWAWCQVQGGAVAYYAGDGIYALSANVPVKISGPIDAIFAAEVNHELDERAHMVYYARRNLLLLWVARLGETRVLDKVIVGDCARWPEFVSWWEFRLPATISRVFLPSDGIERVMLGTHHGTVWVWDVDDVDCPDAAAITLRGTITATDGAGYLEDSNAYYGTHTLAGTQVRMLSGAAIGQRRFVSASTTTRLTIDTRAEFGGYFDPVPAVGDFYALGPIESYWVSPDLSLGTSHRKRWLQTSCVTGKPANGSRLGVHQYTDGQGAMLLRGRTVLRPAWRQQHLVRHQDRSEYLRLRFGNEGPREPWVLRRFTVSAATGRGFR